MKPKKTTEKRVSYVHHGCDVWFANYYEGDAWKGCERVTLEQVREGRRNARKNLVAK